MLLHIKNETRYSGRVLRAIAGRVLRQMQKPGQVDRRVLLLRVKPSRRRTSGCAYLNGATMWLRLPPGKADPLMVAAVIAHEYAHCCGETHEQMGGKPYHLYSETTPQRLRAFYGWADAFPLVERVPKVAARPLPEDRDAARVSRIGDLLRRWEAKKRRAENAIRKYRRSLAYYEKKRAAGRGTGGE